MKHYDQNRREFLKKFAMVSGGALMLSATSMACYGPGPSRTAFPSVVGMAFLDGQSQKVPLQDSQNVPLSSRANRSLRTSSSDHSPWRAPSSRAAPTRCICGRAAAAEARRLNAPGGVIAVVDDGGEGGVGLVFVFHSGNQGRVAEGQGFGGVDVGFERVVIVR